MMVLMVTDLPVPVAPAISRCGILARSATTGLPSRSRPSAIGSAARPRPQSADSISSRRVTIRAIGLGTSTPTAPLPGIGATRMDGARMDIARSSASATMRPAFTPGAGTTSNWVTTGPVVRPAIWPSTLNVLSVSSSDCPNRSSCASPASISSRAGAVSSSIGGVSDSSTMAARRPGRASCFRAGLVAAGSDGGTAGRRNGGRLASTPPPSSAGTSRRFGRSSARRRPARLRFRRSTSAVRRRPPARLPARLQPLQRMPGERRQRQRGQRQESQQHGSRHADLVRDRSRRGTPAPRRPRAPPDPAGATSRSRSAGRHLGQHADDVGDQHAQPDDQHRRPLHVEPAQPVESGQGEADAEQGNTAARRHRAAARGRGRDSRRPGR